jgi:hypothetical protein
MGISICFGGHGLGEVPNAVSGAGLIGHDANGSVADAMVATSFRIVGLGDKGHPLRWFGLARS